jgi:hypothetical protein
VKQLRNKRDKMAAMKNRRPDMTSKATAMVENRSVLATLLAMLCLVFAVNYFLTGPGSDGGSGLGGTGKFGGESGLGGTGKMPDGGYGFKLGATDADKDQPDNDRDVIPAGHANLEALQAELDITTPKPAFDVASLRLSPASAPLLDELDGFSRATEIDINTLSEVDALVASIRFDDAAEETGSLRTLVQSEQVAIAADTLVASLDILDSLMLAEAATEMAVSPMVAANNNDNSDEAIRQRIAMPVRPERPDRFTMPYRVGPVQRVDLPAPPPVRPMRTLSSLLNH